jgi:phage gp29-like protein
LESAEQGDIRAQHELFLDMEDKDGHILAEMGKRKRSLLKVEWDIQPPRNASAAEKKQSGYVKELIQDIPNFSDSITDSLDAIGHGFSCLEKEHELLGKEWLIKSITHRPQTWFQTDTGTRTQIRLRDMTLDGQELWQFGWVVHVHKAKSGYLSRCGLHRALAWPYLFKNYSVGDLAEFLEIYGLPLRLGKYQAGASDDEKATLLRAVMSIGHDAAGIIPEGMAIDFQEAAKGSEAPFESMISWCERTQSKLILGGTLTSQADGKSSTNALGNVHNEVRQDLVEADAVQLAETFTRDLVYPLLALNKGGVEDRRRLPKFVFNFEENEDIAVFSDALPKLVSVGMNRIKLNWVHEKLGIPIAEDGDEVLSLTPAPGSQSQGGATAALTASVETADHINPTAAEEDALAAATAAHWDEMIATVKNMVDNATSMAALQQQLTDAYGSLPSEELVRIMSAGFALAELKGIADVNDGR